MALALRLRLYRKTLLLNSALTAGSTRTVRAFVPP
jgi:hypothetical protein